MFRVALVALLVFVMAFISGCATLDGCFCCNNLCVNYVTDQPKANAASSAYQSGDFELCVTKSQEVRSPTSWNKLVHAKCLEEMGELDRARALYEEMIASDPELKYPPARESKAHLQELATRPSRPPSKARAPSSSATWPDLAQAAPRIGGGERDAAVLVGVADSFVLPDIPGADANVTAWYTFLTGTMGVPPESITLLRNSDATREAIEDAARRASGKAKRRVWFVFVGHGAPTLARDDGLLLGADTQATEKSIESRGLAQKELLALLGATKGVDVVAVFDACFSGNARDGAPLVAGSQATIPVRRAAPAKNALVFSSSELVAGSLAGTDVNSARPAYSYLLLGALRGWADDDRDGKVTALEAHRYVSRMLAATITDRDQTPRLAGEGTTVVAPSAGEAPPDVASIVVSY